MLPMELTVWTANSLQMTAGEESVSIEDLSVFQAAGSGTRSFNLWLRIYSPPAYNPCHLVSLFLLRKPSPFDRVRDCSSAMWHPDRDCLVTAYAPSQLRTVCSELSIQPRQLHTSSPQRFSPRKPGEQDPDICANQRSRAGQHWLP